MTLVAENVDAIGRQAVRAEREYGHAAGRVDAARGVGREGGVLDLVAVEGALHRQAI